MTKAKYQLKQTTTTTRDSLPVQSAEKQFICTALSLTNFKNVVVWPVEDRNCVGAH